MISLTFLQDSDIPRAIGHLDAYDLTELNQLGCS